MFPLAKLHCLCIVICVWLSALLVDKTVPYFPIEISRTASTGHFSQLIFKWGIVSLLPTLVYESFFSPAAYAAGEKKLEDPTLFLVWLGILIAAWIPDRESMVIHGGGVLIIILAVAIHVFMAEAHNLQRNLCVLVCALGIEAARMLIKGFVVWFAELDGGKVWDPMAYVMALYHHADITRHIMKVMFEGVDHAIVPALTIPVLKVTGVMQWMALYLMTVLY